MMRILVLSHVLLFYPRKAEKQNKAKPKQSRPRPNTPVFVSDRCNAEVPTYIKAGNQVGNIQTDNKGNGNLENKQKQRKAKQTTDNRRTAATSHG
jgi:hypothetical protein